jgi:Ca2+-binding EF-hand superfamily protein
MKTMMKRSRFRLALALSAGLAIPAVALAQGGAWKEHKVKKFDKNGDGVIDEAERQEMRARMQERRAEMLAKYDTNNDGELSAEERAQMRKDRAAEAFKRLDTNGDGVLSLAEFEAGAEMRHGGKRFGGKRR